MPEKPELPEQIDWSTFWTRKRDPRWLVRPVVLRAGVTDIVALPGVGKSLLGLYIAACLATGKAVLGQEASAPISCIYLDLEMTEDDVFDRLKDMGFGSASDLSHLHYYALPELPPLDTAAGAAVLHALVRKDKAWLVVIDTTSEVIAGNENDSETFRNLYNHSLYPLKAKGISVLKTDHEGWDSQRSRGSSAKRDKADIQWRMTRKRDRRLLKANKRRQRAIPAQITLIQTNGPPLRYEMEAVPDIVILPSGTEALAAELDRLKVPVTSVRKTQDALREITGRGRSNELVRAAQEFRKQKGA